MNGLKIALAALLIIAIAQCNAPANKQLTGTWQIKEIDLNGTKLQGNWQWKFDEDNGYKADIAGTGEEGQYTIKNNLLTLKSETLKDKPETVYEIEKLDSARLILVSKKNKNALRISFVRKD